MEQEDFICRSFPWQGVPKERYYICPVIRCWHKTINRSGIKGFIFYLFLKRIIPPPHQTINEYFSLFFLYVLVCYRNIYCILSFLQQPNLYLSTELKFGGTQTTAFTPVVEVQAVLDRPIMRTLIAGSRSIQIQIFNK